MSRRRLLFLNNQGLASVGGGTTILRALTTDLARDHDITLLSEDPPTRAGFEEPTLARYRGPQDALWRLKPWLKARYVRRSLDPALIRGADVVVALDPHFALALGATPPRRLVHLSLSCVGRQEWFGSYGSERWFYAPQYALLERRMARQAVAIVAASRLHAREMERFAGCAGRSIDILSPVFPMPVQPAPANRTTELLAVGRITPVKNLGALIPVLRRLPGVRLALLGEGDDPAELQAIAAAEGVADRIEWVGPVEDPTAWIDRAALLLHPSRYESYGMVVQEAMRRGTVPVVFANGPGRMNAAADLVQHGRSGLLVDYGDPDATAAAIADLLDTPDRLAALSSSARAAAAERDSFDYLGTFRALLDRVEQGA
jgi:glycosyltransferase involved in cell wall biosynthesis